MPDRTHLIEAALGERPADLVLENGRIANVFAQEVVAGGVAALGGVIVGVGDLPTGATGTETEVRDVDGAFLLPGFIDAHMHVGGSYLPLGALAAALLERGTTALATDLYEPYAMFGAAGVRECVRAAEEVGLRMLLMTPAHLLGFERYGTFAHTPDFDELLEMGRWPETVAVNEPPPFVVLSPAENQGTIDLIDDMLRQRKVFEGHALGLQAPALQAYMAAGASSDHEAGTLAEARAALRAGYRVIMREGSASRDLPELAPLLQELPQASRFVSVCSDEIEPKDLIAEGHVDHKLRVLVDSGVDPLVALQTATINTAEYLGVADQLGSIAPGRRADVLVVDRLEEFRPRQVFAAGELVAEGGRSTADPERFSIVPEALRSRVVLAHSPAPEDFAHRTSVEDEQVRVRLMEVVDGTLLSERREHRCEVREGVVLADPAADVLDVAMLERHTGSGRIGRAFMRGLGFADGALAMTYCHVHQNMLVAGTSPEQMALAAQEVERLGGGIAVVAGRAVSAGLALPTGGVLANADLESVAAGLRTVEEAIRALGCQLTSPVLSIAFSVLPTIPAYGLTDFGLYDTEADQFVDVILDGVES